MDSKFVRRILGIQLLFLVTIRRLSDNYFCLAKRLLNLGKTSFVYFFNHAFHKRSLHGFGGKFRKEQNLFHNYDSFLHFRMFIQLDRRDRINEFNYTCVKKNYTRWNCNIRYLDRNTAHGYYSISFIDRSLRIFFSEHAKITT